MHCYQCLIFYQYILLSKRRLISILSSRVLVRLGYISVSLIISFPVNEIPTSTIGRLLITPCDDVLSLIRDHFCKARSYAGRWANFQSQTSFCSDGILPIGLLERERLVRYTLASLLSPKASGKVLDFSVSSPGGSSSCLFFRWHFPSRFRKLRGKSIHRMALLHDGCIQQN